MLSLIRFGLVVSRSQSRLLLMLLLVSTTFSPNRYANVSSPPNLWIMLSMMRSFLDVDAEYL